jgi:V8-like Glu-specific endopeptidase
MATPGHLPVSNDDSEFEAIRIDEAAVAPPTNRVSLPYYHPPTRPATEIFEAAPMVDDDEFPPNFALPDVAIASFGDTGFLEAVIGNDDRVKVAKEMMSGNPWRQICSLRIRSKSNQVYVGTAWFIGPKTLATAGHCVFLKNDGGWAKSIEVIPARFGSDKPFDKLTATRFAAVDGWTKESSRDFDYGVIHLEDATVGQKVGNFEVRSFPDGIFNNMQLKVSGYPADREQAQFQYFHERPIQEVTATRLRYDIDTFGGQSGSPIWQDTEEHGLVAVGVHTTGGISSNSGTRINDNVIENLISWMEA